MTDARRACPRSVIGGTVGAYPRGTGSKSNPVEGSRDFSLIPPALSFVFLWHASDGPTQWRSLQMPDVAVPQIGVGPGVFHAWLFHDGAGGWVSEVFVSTDARRACPRSVIGSTVGASQYPRGTGSNPVEGHGHFSPSYCQLYLSSFSDTHPVEGNGHFFPSYRQLYLASFFDTHTHTHTHTHTLVVHNIPAAFVIG